MRGVAPLGCSRTAAGGRSAAREELAVRSPRRARRVDERDREGPAVRSARGSVCPRRDGGTRRAPATSLPPCAGAVLHRERAPLGRGFCEVCKGVHGQRRGICVEAVAAASRRAGQPAPSGVTDPRGSRCGLPMRSPCLNYGTGCRSGCYAHRAVVDHVANAIATPGQRRRQRQRCQHPPLRRRNARSGRAGTEVPRTPPARAKRRLCSCAPCEGVPRMPRRVHPHQRIAGNEARSARQR